jgi:flagellar biosynthesis chaperone FliJ
MTQKDLATDIAVIKNEIKNISTNISKLEKVTDNYCKKLDDVENKQVATAEKVSNLAVFQAVFSTIVGAIATYLGVTKQ